MRKLLFAMGAVIATGLAITYIPTIMNAQQETVQEQTPAYAKWGKVAIEQVQSKYPNASIVDYLHVGRETQQDTTTETFKLWLNEGDREFGVFVYITFVTASEKVINIQFKETDK
ncbi:DUF3889 domain-containing protein [Lysinibacillus sp. KU-BSD001]|uniref:DUF3889 domain-containing protein n=1 Tax=Lysinibacillus sp. KU-BSD001 TaxID=3141328 RepID=UPI0036EED5F6